MLSHLNLPIPRDRARGLSLFGRAVAGAAAIACAVSIAAAETRAPSGPIEITVGTSPGGTPDVIMRQVARLLADEGLVEQPMVVQNRTGGSWTVSSNYVLGRSGDENLVYAIAQPVLTTPIVQGQPTVYDKLTPIAMFVQGDLIVVGQPDAEESTLAEVIERARQEPGSISVAGAQAGSTDHLTTAMVETVAGVDLNYVPFDGGSAALAAFLGGNVDLTILSPVEAAPMIEAGRVKPLAILSEERRTEPELADIPTAMEQGYDILWGQAWGLAGPPDLDPAVADWWGEKIATLVESEAWADFLKENYFRTRFIGRDGAEAELQRLHEEHLAVLREVGLAKQ